jgi:hypothetical protein
MLLCPQKPSLFAQIIKQRSLNGSVCLKAPTEQTSVYSCSWKSNINSVLPQLSPGEHSVTSTNAIQNAIISCWRLSWPTRWCLKLNSTSLRVTSEDFGHSTLPYVEVTGNFILSETSAAETYWYYQYCNIYNTGKYYNTGNTSIATGCFILSMQSGYNLRKKRINNDFVQKNYGYPMYM